MTQKDAVKFCENTECENCYIEINNIEYRTKYEKEMLHYPCCMNLVDKKYRYEMLDKENKYNKGEV